MKNTGNTKGIPSGNQTETGTPMMMAVGMMMSEDEDDDGFMIHLSMTDG